VVRANIGDIALLMFMVPWNERLRWVFVDVDIEDATPNQRDVIRDQRDPSSLLSTDQLAAKPARARMAHEPGARSTSAREAPAT
jgi:hypothetical protein